MHVKLCFCLYARCGGCTLQLRGRFSRVWCELHYMCRVEFESHACPPRMVAVCKIESVRAIDELTCERPVAESVRLCLWMMYSV